MAIQGLQLRNTFPDSSCTFGHGSLVWEGAIQPTPLSDSYRMRLEYRHGELPNVRIIEPEIQSRNGSHPEHLYPDGSLCLFYPRHREWNHGMLLARTVVPWASEWLLHYEIWLKTGEWCGGGIHPGKRKEQEARDLASRPAV